MVSDHSSSASLSSFSFSHFSHTSSSSPSSSPDSAPSSLQDRNCFASSASSTLSIVPFVWEEKPGVLKKEMQVSEGDEQELGEGNPSPLARCDSLVRNHRGDANLLSSKRLSKTFPTPRSKACSESLPRLRPPPRLSQPEHAHAQDDDAHELQRLHQHHHHCRTLTGVGSKVMSSLPFHKRRHHRTPSLEDDPFWRAMVACTNDAGKGGHMRLKGCREDVSGEISRGDSWLAKKVQGHSLHFEQCVPCHVREDDHSRKKERASSHASTTRDEAASSAEGIKLSTSHTHAHYSTNADANSTRLAGKAFKALNTARAELNVRCKALMQQQPPVDISCGSRRSKKRS